MSAQCTGTPVSWLRLEQWSLGELPAEQAATVAAHVEDCAVCRACADQAAVQAVGLLALPALEAAPQPWWRSWGVWAGGLVAAVAVLLLLVARPGDGMRSGTTKGGDDLAVELVRESGGTVSQDPARFAPGDRFKLLVTCAAGTRHVDVVVVQPGEVSFPLAPVALTCGNRVAVPGAFTLTGGPAQVCVVARRDGPPDRDRMRAGTPVDAVCAALSPVLP